MAKKQSFRRLKGYYGVDQPAEVAGLVLYGAVMTACALVLYYCFGPLCKSLSHIFSFLPKQVFHFIVGFSVGIVGLLAAAFWVTLANTLYTSLYLKFRIARRMVSLIDDWSAVESALDVGCGRGLLLNTLALRLLKERAGGRAVGVDLWDQEGAGSMAVTLRAAAREGVEQLVTCKHGHAQDLPFTDSYFDVVVSALCFHQLGQGPNPNSPAAKGERRRALQEALRVLKPGGRIVIWDLLHAHEYAEFFEKRGLEDVYVSSSISAFMMTSHIVAARKPKLGRTETLN
eukprot:jgi/Mesen1/3515/ME000197S02531